MLEVILALALTAMVVTLVGTAVNSTLRTVDSCRRRTEREQLARAIMQQIAEDLRSVVRYEPFDSSGLEASTSGSSSGSSGGGSGGSSSGGSSSGSGGSSSSGGSSQSGSGGSSNSSSGSSSSQSGQTETEDPDSATLTTPIAGIYGDQSYVQIDVTRIPRLDQYLYADGINTPLPRGDIHTVTYYLAGSLGTVAPAATPGSTAASAGGSSASTGLTRTEVPRALAMWQSQSASVSQTQAAVVLAPEVESLQFRYFDGTQWQTQWDSTVYGGVPRAVEISIYLQNDQTNAQHPTAMMYTGSGAIPVMDNPDNLYRLVVHLPAGLPLPAIPAAMTDDSTQDDSSSSSSSSTSGSGGTSGGTGSGNGQQKGGM